MMKWGLFFTAAAFPCMLVLACASHNGPGGAGAGSDGGAGGGYDGAVLDGGLLYPTVGQLDAAPPTNLPPLPKLTNVTATEREDSVGIDFDPVDTAVDYRVYPLPNDSDVTTNADGSVTVKNAVYR